MGDDNFWWAFGRTVMFITIALNLELLLGLGLALLVNKITWGQRTLRTIMMFPMMFSPILVGFQFKYIFNDSIGLVNNALFDLGLIDKPIAWLVDGTLANFLIIFAEIWMSTSIFAILLLAGLLALPKEPIEAAKVDGCNPWQVFRHITLPFLMPFIFIAMTIRSLDVARAYDMVRIMTNGGPAGRTELIWTLMTRTGYQNSQMGMANAMGYVSILLSIRSEEHTSELQSRPHLVCRLLLEKKKEERARARGRRLRPHKPPHQSRPRPRAPPSAARRQPLPGPRQRAPGPADASAPALAPNCA